MSQSIAEVGALTFSVLGVPYHLVGKTFEEIRTSFEKETNSPGITVPAIQDGGKWLWDSFALAEFVSIRTALPDTTDVQLEKKYGKPGRSLFGGSEEGVAFARFVNTWADKDLGNEIVPLFAPWLYQAEDPESAAWFLKQKGNNDKAKFEFLISAVKDPKFVETQVGNVRDKLTTIERYLAENKANGKGQFLLGTDYPTHADAAIWGWYVATQAIRPLDLDLVNRIWKHESLPLVSQWVEAVGKQSGAKPEFPY